MQFKMSYLLFTGEYGGIVYKKKKLPETTAFY